MEVLQNTRNTTTKWFSNSTPGYTLKKKKTKMLIWKDTHTPTFTILLSINTMSSSSIYLYPGVDGHSGYFCILAFIDNNIMNKAVINIHVQVSVWS